MIFPFILLAVCLACYMNQYPAARLDWPEDLQTFCPHTKFCHLNASKPIPTQNSRASRQTPCCKPCSCSEDCGLDRNCCNVHFDIHKLDETLGTVCKSLNTKEFADRKDELFHLIDKCPSKLDTCRFTNTSIYGSFLPVFSRVNKMIYYNSHCAACHYQTDISTFIPSLSCPYIDKSGLYELFNVINGVSSQCFFEFRPPSEIDISHLVCYPHMIRQCPFKSDVETEIKCSSFNATFLSNTFRYQNVYCYLCNRKGPFREHIWSEKYTMCPESINRRSEDISDLTVLLDPRTVQDIEKSLMNTAKGKPVCFENTNASTKVCRPILCPEGQFIVQGACKVLGETWFVHNLTVFLNLTPVALSRDITVDDMRQVSDQQLSSPLKKFLSRPSLETWEIHLYYNLNHNRTSVVSFMAVLVLRNKVVKPDYLLLQVDKAVKRVWKLKINKKTFKLKGQFNRYQTYYLLEDGSMYTPPQYNAGKSNGLNIDKWSNTGNDKFEFNVFAINKLFFCDQVELMEGEFNYTDKLLNMVFINESGKVLGDAEYKVTRGEDGLKRGIRVCLDDVFPESNGFRNRDGWWIDMWIDMLLIWLIS